MSHCNCHNNYNNNCHNQMANDLDNDLNYLKEQRAANFYIQKVVDMHNEITSGSVSPSSIFTPNRNDIDRQYANFERVCDIYNKSGNKYVSQQTKGKVLDYIVNNNINDDTYTMQLLCDVQNGKVKRLEYKLHRY